MGMLRKVQSAILISSFGVLLVLSWKISHAPLPLTKQFQSVPQKLPSPLRLDPLPGTSKTEQPVPVTVEVKEKKPTVNKFQAPPPSGEGIPAGYVWYRPWAIEPPQARPSLALDLPSKRLAIVIPFIPDQLYQISELVSSLWIQFPPSQPARPYFEFIDLVFYIDTNWVGQPPIDIGPVKRFFREVKGISANTPDYLAHQHPQGPGYMFYQLFENEELLKGYDYFFLMEPDTVPVRPYWLDHIYQEVLISAVSDFWVKGSIVRRCKPFYETCEKPSPATMLERQHINGNAIYKLGSSQFNYFLKEVQQRYDLYAYDAAIQLMLTDIDNWALLEHSRSYFVYTEFIQNMYDDSMNFEEKVAVVENYYPQTYLVHK